MSLRDFRRLRAANDDEIAGKTFVCTRCGSYVWQSIDTGTFPLCAICNFLSESSTMSPSEKEALRQHAGPAFSQPPASSPASDDCGAVPVTEPRATFGMVDNLVVAIVIALACGVVVKLFG